MRDWEWPLVVEHLLRENKKRNLKKASGESSFLASFQAMLVHPGPWATYQEVRYEIVSFVLQDFPCFL
jgi:hypothetical protein